MYKIQPIAKEKLLFIKTYKLIESMTSYFDNKNKIVLKKKSINFLIT